MAVMMMVASQSVVRVRRVAPEPRVVLVQAVTRQRRHLMRDSNKDGEGGVKKSTTDTKLTLSAKVKARVAMVANAVDDATARDEVAIAARVVCACASACQKERNRRSSASHSK